MRKEYQHGRIEARQPRTWPAVVSTGMDVMARVDHAIEAARSCKPLSAAQRACLLKKTHADAGRGECEPFRTSPRFDSTATHPQWLGDAP